MEARRLQIEDPDALLRELQDKGVVGDKPVDVNRPVEQVEEQDQPSLRERVVSVTEKVNTLAAQAAEQLQGLQETLGSLSKASEELNQFKAVFEAIMAEEETPQEE